MCAIFGNGFFPLSQAVAPFLPHLTGKICDYQSRLSSVFVAARGPDRLGQNA
jgi:hypothetical protein